MSTEVHLIIPARYHSSRLPGKMLLPVAGKPLVQRVYERAIQCIEQLQAQENLNICSLHIATDDVRIESLAKEFGAQVIMTSVDHATGTDRLAEASELLGFSDQSIVVNIQGDEPLFPFEAVSLLVHNLNRYTQASMSTLCHPLAEKELRDIDNPNMVKVVLDQQGYALYFSRKPLMQTSELAYRHIGMYGYRVQTLGAYRNWIASPLEMQERLEQLRFLWQGHKIHVGVLREALPPGVDTEVELKLVSDIFAS